MFRFHKISPESSKLLHPEEFECLPIFQALLTGASTRPTENTGLMKSLFEKMSCLTFLLRNIHPCVTSRYRTAVIGVLTMVIQRFSRE
jgi:hypothetical protein